MLINEMIFALFAMIAVKTRTSYVHLNSGVFSVLHKGLEWRISI